MKICLRLVCSVIIASSLVSCQAATGLLGMPLRVLQLLGRTVGGLTEADSPDTSLEAIEKRGSQIQQRGPHSPIAPALPTSTAVVQR